MGCSCPSQAEIWESLERVAPGVPLLALGQTVFWDEPLKAGVAQSARSHGVTRRFVAGVHDTDYFAKAPSGFKKSGLKGGRGYAIAEHNDTTTQGLWSAAAEFSVLFASETVVTRDLLAQHGASLARLESGRPGLLDSLTAAWGWRGLVEGGTTQRVVSETRLGRLFPVLFEALDSAVSESVEMIAGPKAVAARGEADRFLKVVCDTAGDREEHTLASYYERLLPEIWAWVSGGETPNEATTTMRLLALTAETALKPRFDLVGLFLNSETQAAARAAYDAAVRGTEMYTLDRFGTGAIPFDLVIPGVGRGTVRIGRRGLVVMTPRPVAVSFKRAPETVADLADLVERTWGPGCALVGKAVTLIGMLSREFVFVFHEGGSSYVSRSRAFHQGLAAAGLHLGWHPILRVSYPTWESLSVASSWFALPDVLQRPFACRELSAPSFQARLAEVATEQRALKARLAHLRRPIELLEFLQERLGGPWKCLAAQYQAAGDELAQFSADVAARRAEKRGVFEAIKAKKAEIDRLEHAKGEQWRAEIFEREPGADALARRKRFEAQIGALHVEVRGLWERWRTLQAELDARVDAEDVERAKQRRAEIAFEAELARAGLIREAIVAVRGLERAGRRPAAWWFPIVSPDGAWFREVHRRAQYSLEPLS